MERQFSLRALEGRAHDPVALGLGHPGSQAHRPAGNLLEYHRTSPLWQQG